MNKFNLVLLIMLFLKSTFCFATPKTMCKITSAKFGYKIRPGQFESQPITQYRAEYKYGRSEEKKDYDVKIHGLLIVNEPDIWLINKWDNSCKHVVDPGPTFNFHNPVFPYTDFPKSIKNLEYCYELEFFKKKNIKPIKSEIVLGKNANVYEFKSEGYTIRLYFSKENNAPLKSTYLSPQGHEGGVVYNSYEPNVKFESTLFEKPKNIHCIEEKSKK